MEDTEKEQIIREIFDMIDKDKSNTLTISEIDEALKKYSENIDIKLLTGRLKAQFDLNQEMTFEEFHVWMLKEFNVAEARGFSKNLRDCLKAPAFEVVLTLEDLKNRVESNDKVLLEWCIEQILSSKFNSYQPAILPLKHSFLQKDAFEIIEEHSPLPSLRLALSDEKSSSASLMIRRSVMSKNSDLDFQISIPQANFDINDFDLPIFKLAEEYGNGVLLNMYAWKAFNHWDIFNALDIDQQVFLRYVSCVGDGYKDNSYHNVLHAADVMQACQVFLIASNLYELSSMNEIHAASLLLAAIIHDYKHPGLNNSYLIKSGHKLALRYNDQSVLENFHVSKAFNLAQNETMNIFQKLPKEVYRTIRKFVISAVLATDMTKHSKHVGEVQTKLYKNKNLTEEKEFILGTLIHLADLSNPCRESSISDNWALRVSEEFFLQGDRERESGWEISPLCDRHTVNIAKSQVGFISGVIIPFITPICRELTGMRFLQKNAKVNMDGWAEKIQEYQEKISLKIE